MQQLETARKEGSSKDQQLQMELEKQRYTGSMLDKQLTDE